LHLADTRANAAHICFVGVELNAVYKKGASQMADIQEVDYIWKNGEIIPWAEATTHVLSHSLHYGSGVFEGIRCYKDPDSDKSFVFRLQDHMRRLHNSAKISMIDLPYTVEELCDATVELIRKNNLPACYIRPIVYRGYGVMGVDPTGAQIDVVIACWPWDSYLGEDALANGISVGVSSWRQRSINAIPPAVKSTAAYYNSLLAKLEAKSHGYAEAIMLNEEGHVCEGTGENLFIVRDGVLSTPPLSDGVLEGITRDSVLVLADDLEIPALEESLTRADLYVADEVFMSGSAAELTPIGSVDDRPIGKPGEITRRLQDKFFEVVYGHDADYADWLTEI
jgi:branched-chain amino acid aminotransferase